MNEGFEQDLVALDRYLRQHRPAYYAALNKGGSTVELAQIADRAGLADLGDLGKFYLWKDGQAAACTEPLIYNFEFMPLASVQETMDVVESMRGAEIDDDLWNGWIPFLSNGASDNVCVDRLGAFGGHADQVLEVWHKEPAKVLITFPSFAAWLKFVVWTLDQGIWHMTSSGFQPDSERALRKMHEAMFPGYPRMVQIGEVAV